MDRREFIRSCGCTGAGVLGLAALLQACKSASYIPYTEGNKQLAIKKSDMAGKSIGLLRSGGRLPAPVAIVNDNGKYHAMLLLCTHKECELSLYGQVFHCPCHGSEFDLNGKVLQGPADKPLTVFNLTADEEYIYIR